MPHELLEPRFVGADEKLICLHCGNPMRLKNCGPDAVYGLRYERQIFTNCCVTEKGICDVPSFIALLAFARVFAIGRSAIELS
jgi:hypothetical protein